VDKGDTGTDVLPIGKTSSDDTSTLEPDTGGRDAGSEDAGGDDTGQEDTSDTEPERLARICIDPGWVTDSNDTRQLNHDLALINRKVSFYLEALFDEENYETVLTVSDEKKDILFDIYTDDDINDEYKFFKGVSLDARIAKCNDAEADYLISVQHNSANDSSANYTRVYVYDSADKAWGTMTAERVAKVMGKAGGEAHDKAEYRILKETKMPGIMVLASFYSNLEEKERLNNNQYLEKEAQAIFDAFVAFHPN
jgi:N-acetylmuramoyl-L-alanine amidase